MNTEKKPLGFLGSHRVSPFLARVFLGIAVIVILSLLTTKCFAHIHLEIELPEHVWEQMAKEENRQAHDRVQKDPENASKSDKDKSFQHKDDNSG
jgi:hypothetical protein